MKVLSYKDWRYFDAVIEKAKMACQNSELTAIDHFAVNNKMVEIGSGAKGKQKDYKLTRYDCYLIAQNANPRLKKDNIDTEKKACDTHNKIEKTINENI